MKTSYQLLKKYVDIKESPEALAEKLTMAGLEVETIQHFAPRVSQVVVGKILKKEQHPNAERLTVCQVDVKTQILNIVCGAKNHQEGDKVAVSLIGSRLPNGMEIQKTKLRGVISEGMICSKAELGLEEKSEGVWILAPEAEIGKEINAYLPEEDWIYDISVTANRSDCLSTLGIAREVAVIEKTRVKYPRPQIKEESSVQKPNITIEAEDLCNRYASRIIRGVKIQESPQWLQEALTRYGSRPINNIVDITNYILFELGQPLHAFDLQKLEGQKIIVRRAKKGEKITTLDNEEHKLDDNILVIADARKPLAIAGVIGGANSKVDENTVDILLESAYFAPHSIRKTAKKLGIRTEASYRFEREIDPENVVRALDYAVELIIELGGGKASALTDNYPVPLIIQKSEVRKNFIEEILGFSLEPSRLEEIFDLLEFKYEKKGQDYWITFPSFRRDCKREIDAVEEIIRIYGYTHLPETMHPIPMSLENFNSKERFEDRIRQLLWGMGIDEAYNLSFMGRKAADQYNLLEAKNIITIKNPLNKEYDSLRTTLFPSLLANLKVNNEHGNFRVSLFEIGKIFWQEEEYREKKKLGILFSGPVASVNWTSPAQLADFYWMKGLVEELLRGLKRDQAAEMQKGSIAFLHPGKTALLFFEGKPAGFLGELHPNVVLEQELKAPTVYAEVDLEILEQAEEPKIRYQKMSKYPEVEKEIALVLDQDIEARSILDIILQESELVKKADVFDVYTGKQIPQGKKSVTFSFVLQAEDRTLTNEEIHKIMNEIIRKAKQKTGAMLREG